MSVFSGESERDTTREITGDMLQLKRALIDDASDRLNDCIKDMDQKLNRVLKRQEEEYLKGYSIYVREKERELRDLVTKLNERNQNSSLKDEIIFGFKAQITSMYETTMRAEKETSKLKAELKVMSASNDYLKSD